MLSSIHTSAGRLFLALGTEVSTGTSYRCLTPSQSSWKVTVDSTQAVPISVYRGMEQTYLSYGIAHLFSNHILASLPATTSSQTVIVNKPDAAFAGTFSTRAASRGMRVVFTTIDAVRAQKKHWLRLHPMAPERTMRAAIPQITAAVFDMGSNDAARYAVLSSRNPQLPVKWVALHEGNGVNVAGIRAQVKIHLSPPKKQRQDMC